MTSASRRATRLLRTFAPSALLAALASVAGAQTTYLTTVLQASQETPPTSSTGTGFASMVLDQTAHTLTYHVEYSGLTSAENAAHIHCCAPAGSAAGVTFVFGLGSPKTGVFATTPTQESNILAGLAYVNIHTSMFPGGEVRGQLSAAPAPTAFCAGDGSGTACPCANSSGAGANEGCLNSLGTGGKLTATGFASVSSDSVVLHGTQMPNSSALYFQGTGRVAGGAGAVFGDGLRCAGGSVVRLGTKTNAAGASQYPVSGDPAVATKGGVQSSGTRNYQVWYRNAANFCSVSTFNLTNGLQLTWVP